LDIGLKQIAQSPQIAAETLAAAKRIAGNANAVGDSKYEAESQTVAAGWNNERRSGAVVRETDPHWKDWRDAVLLRVTNAMKERRQ